MAFVSFIDFLLLIEVALVFAAALVGYTAIVGYYAMRKNDLAGLKGVLRGSAVPLAALGGVLTVLGLYIEAVWPFPLADGMGSYDLLFGDVILLFGMTLVILAVSMATGHKLQYAGLFAFIAGGFTIAYGYTAWQIGLTKDPLDMFLLYLAFGGVGLFSFPVTVAVDRYLAAPDAATFQATVKAPATSGATRRWSIYRATRAVVPIAPAGSGSEAGNTQPAVGTVFRLPLYFNIAIITFVIMAVLAAVAGLYFVSSTLPGHLTHAP